MSIIIKSNKNKEKWQFKETKEKQEHLQKAQKK